jgi:Sulfotransferase family
MRPSLPGARFSYTVDYVCLDSLRTLMTAAIEHAAPTDVSRARVPDFFIVGHAKCGTTALYEMLKRHPQIYMPEYKQGWGKEPWFFSRDNPHPQTSGERSVAFTGRRQMTLDEYLSLFANATPEQRIGEASTSYLWSRSAAGRIAALRPDAKIIAILREPASFLRSLHFQLLVNHHESEIDFRKAVALDEPRREGLHIPSHSYWPQALIYSDRVRYVEQLRRYHAAFPPEQVLVLIYDDFRSQNEATVRRVLHFLDVDDGHQVEAVEANPTITLRSTWINDMRRSLRAGQGPIFKVVKGTGKALTSRRIRTALYYPAVRFIAYRRPAPPDESFMRELRSRFKPEVVALSEYLDRDLVTLWGYDNVD